MEISEILKNTYVSRRLKPNSFDAIINRVLFRILLLKYFLLQKISSKDFCEAIIPSKIMKKKNRRLIYDVLDEVILKGLDITLNNRSIDFQEGSNIRLVNDLYCIVKNDQYHARDYLRKDSIIIDAGANHGIFSLLAASISTQGKVYAFEPVTEAFLHLQKNVKGMSNISTVKAALGGVDGNSKIVFNRQDLYISTLIDTGICRDHRGMFNDSEIVKVYKLDTFVKQYKIPKICFLKVDTEGSELQILNGAKECIRKFKPTISISAYHQKNDKKEIVDLILSFDPTYQYFLSSRGEEDLIFYHNE